MHLQKEDLGGHMFIIKSTLEKKLYLLNYRPDNELSKLIESRTDTIDLLKAKYSKGNMKSNIQLSHIKIY